MSNERSSPFKYFIAGGFGGLCTVITGHPLDTIKIRLQTRPDLYKSTWSVLKKIITDEGPFSLYKGMSAPLVSVMPLFAVSFLGFGIGKKLVTKPGQIDDFSNGQILSAGMISGLGTSFVTAPSERIKCLLQMQLGNSKRYNGFWDCALKLWKAHGIRNIYLGTCATLLRDVPTAGIYFFTYDRVLKFLMIGSQEITWQPLIAGGCAGISMWIVAMPADVIKSRLQTSEFGTYPRGVREVLPSIVREEGFMALYRGITPVMLRAFPANAACFLGFEICLTFLNKYLPRL